jgi:hypothetical protein
MKINPFIFINLNIFKIISMMELINLLSTRPYEFLHKIPKGGKQLP